MVIAGTVTTPASQRTFPAWYHKSVLCHSLTEGSSTSQRKAD